MALAVNFSKKSLVILTGASRGIGRTIAIKLAELLNQNSIVALIARSESGLQETKKLMTTKNKSLTILTFPLDLGKPNIQEYETLIEKILSSIVVSDIEYGICFHNAGLVGSVKQTTALTDLQEWREYFDLNLFSVTLLNSIFIKKIKPICNKLVVVNITSLCGRQPFKDLAMYGSGKAARELFFRVLATEEPNIIVLNYSPGPVDTDMFNDIAENAESSEVRSSFKAVKETQILTTDQTVSKLMNILEKGDYKSGDTLDYFDRI